MSSIVCIEVEFEDKAVVEKVFEEIETAFWEKTQGLPQKVSPKIFKKENKIIVEINLVNSIIANLCLPMLKLQLGDKLEKMLAEKGHKAKTRCYTK